MKYRLLVSIVAGLLLSLLVIRISDSQVSQLSGLAVAQSKKWVGLRDAGVGDGISDGIGAFSLMMYDNVNGVFNRLRGSTNFGILVDVARIQGSIIVTGNKTLADNFVNPTDAISTGAFNMYWDGSNWQRWRAFQVIDNVSFSSLPDVASVIYGFDGSNFDLIRVSSDNGINPTLGKLAVLPCIAKATPLVWTDGNIVPCNTTTSGSIRVSQFDVPGSGVSVWNVTNTQGYTLFNSQTTGAANTSVVVTIPASASVRAMVHSIEAQCSSGSSNITIKDGTNVIFTSMGNNVPASPSTYRREWSTPLTGTVNTAMTIELASCGVSNTGTLHVQASRW